MMLVGIEISDQWAGSSAAGWFKEISAKTVTLSPFCKWPRTSPVKSGWPRTLTTSPLTVAVPGGSSTTLFLTEACFLLGASGAASGWVWAAGETADGAGEGGAADGARVVSCARPVIAVSVAMTGKIQFRFITGQVEI